MFPWDNSESTYGDVFPALEGYANVFSTQNMVFNRARVCVSYPYNNLRGNANESKMSFFVFPTWPLYRSFFQGISRERLHCPWLFGCLTMMEVPTVEIPDATQDAVETPGNVCRTLRRSCAAKASLQTALTVSIWEAWHRSLLLGSWKCT